MQPTYYVRHPDDTYSAAEPQPTESLVNATMSALSQLGRMVGNSEHENNRIRAALTGAFYEHLPLATPADAGAGEALTDERTRFEHYAEHQRGMEAHRYTRDAHFNTWQDAQREVLARMSTPGAPVTAEPVATYFHKDIDSIADELEAEALNYEGDFADTVKGCAEALRQIAERATPAPADRDAIRDQALEEIAKWYGETGWLLDEEYVEDAIRAMKSMERAADAEETETITVTNTKTGESVEWKVPKASVEAAQRAADSMERAADAAETRDAKGGE